MISRRALLLASSCAVLPRAFAGEAGVLKRGNRFEPGSLDPHKINTTYEGAIVLDLFEGLTAYDADGAPGPGLAQSWSVSPDGLRYTFFLRAGLQWSDGSPLAAEDVVFSLRRLLDRKTAAPAAQLLYVIQGARAVNTGTAAPETLSVTAPDAGSVTIVLEAPAPYLPQILASPAAVMVPRAAIAAKGDAWAREGMVSNGAFTLQAWRPNDVIMLAKNPRYHGAASVQLARVDYVPTEDVNAGLTRFRAGDLDTQLDLPPSQLAKLKEELPTETRLTSSLLTYYLALNTTIPKLADKRVRRALSLAIDRDVLTAKVLRGGEQPAYSFVPPLVAGYTPAQMDFAATEGQARLLEARRLLGEAGYGVGKPFSIAYAHSSNLELRRIAVIIAGMWKRIGVETALINTEGRVHFANLRQGSFEAAFVGWQADYNDAQGFLTVLDSATRQSNYARYRNPAYDALLREAGTSDNAPARAGLLHDAEALLMTDQPIIPLYYGVAKNLVARRVAGWRDNAADVHLSRYLSLV
jgi:oligopeptide transport system substrate-binding protein